MGFYRLLLSKSRFDEGSIDLVQLSTKILADKYKANRFRCALVFSSLLLSFLIISMDYPKWPLMESFSRSDTSIPFFYWALIKVGNEWGAFVLIFLWMIQEWVEYFMETKSISNGFSLWIVLSFSFSSLSLRSDLIKPRNETFIGISRESIERSSENNVWFILVIFLLNNKMWGRCCWLVDSPFFIQYWLI